jgi:hypothetical protein
MENGYPEFNATGPESICLLSQFPGYLMSAFNEEKFVFKASSLSNAHICRLTVFSF